MPLVSLNNESALDDLRRQFILAQVELQQLVDARDEARSELAARERLLAELQQVADTALRDSERLMSSNAEFTDQLASFQQQLHVTAQAYEDARNETVRLNTALGLAAGRENELKVRIAALDVQRAEQVAHVGELERQAGEKDRNLHEVQKGAQELLARMDELESELRELKASRSWRWTAWIRFIVGRVSVRQARS